MATATTHMRHPFAPLTPKELEEAVAIVRANQAGSEHIRFVMSRLHEPSPEIALSYQPGDGVPREVFFSLLDKTPGLSGAYEAIVNLTEGKVTSGALCGAPVLAVVAFQPSSGQTGALACNTSTGLTSVTFQGVTL